MAARVLKTLLIQLPKALAPTARAAHKTGFLHHAKMFGDGLTRHSSAGGEPADGSRSFVAKADDQPQANGVPKSREEGHGAEQLCACNGIRLPAQGISRRAE